MKSGSWKALLAATLMLGAVGLGGCAREDAPSDLVPAGDPEILELFVIDGDGVSKMAAGNHPEIKDDPDDNIAAIYADKNGPVLEAIVSGNRLRVIFDELLEASTVEQFTCACYASGCATRGHTFTNTEVDVNRCTSCEDDTTTPTINETGQCLDADFDGVPDDAFLQPQLASVQCTNTTAGAVTVDISESEGWYNPSGNQQIPTALGTNALGPALVLAPRAMPTDADCSVVINSAVTDKDGNTVPMPAFPLEFHTEPLLVVGTSPADGQTGVTLANFDSDGDMVNDVFRMDIQLNALIEVTIAADAVTVATGGNPVPGTTSVDAADATLIHWTSDAALSATTMYDVAIGTGVIDEFGSPLPQADSASFTTGAM
jgi:hypothetical protein